MFWRPHFTIDCYCRRTFDAEANADYVIDSTADLAEILVAPVGWTCVLTADTARQ